MAVLVVVGLVSIIAHSPGCGGAQKSGNTDRGLADFSCDGRRVEYAVVGGFLADEAGVTMDCDGEDPRLTKWRVEADGQRKSSTHKLTAEQFEAVWNKVDSAGWRNLDEECDNPDAADDDPAYSIAVGDHAVQVNLSCSGKQLPFPYDRLVNELDLRAAGFGDGPGDAP